MPNDEQPTTESFFHRHRLMFFGLGLVLAIGLVLLVVYLLLPPATPDVVINFSDPGMIMAGNPFPLTITVSNPSKSIIQNAALSIALPAGISVVGDDPTQRVVTETVGTLSSQTINPPQTLELVASATTTETSQTVPVTLTYETAETAGTVFETNARTSVTIGSESSLSLSYNAPSSIFSGRNFDLVVTYQNNTTGTLQGIQLHMQYPPAYNFVKTNTSPPIDSADTTWDLGTLAPNATGTLTITGNITGPEQAQYQLIGTIGASFSGQNYPAYTAPVNFVITPSPLSFMITLNNSSTYVAGLGTSLNYSINYTNNSNVAFQTVNISATLVGQMYNLPSLQTNGSFDSQNNTITWYTANTPQLASIPPGQSGSVNFSVNTKPAFPIHLISDKDYSLNVTAQIESPTVPPNTVGADTVSVASLTNKVGGEITLGASAYVHELSTPIRNTGPFPPKVNDPTEYTIHWNITNYSTDAKNVTVSAYLQSGTTFTGQEASNVASSSPTYNPATGLVTWTIPFIPATAGVISPPLQAVFQVSNTPSVNQVNQPVTLMGVTTLTATDAFTSSTVQVSAPSVTSEITNDPSVSGEQGIVTQ